MTQRMALYLNRLTSSTARCVCASTVAASTALCAIFSGSVSRLGDGVFWYAVMIGILITQGHAGIQPVLHMLLAGVSGTLLYKWLKGKTLRPRPYEVHQDIWLTGRPLDRFSFPSGHTLHAVAFCSVALVYYPILGLVVVAVHLSGGDVAGYSRPALSQRCAGWRLHRRGDCRYHLPVLVKFSTIEFHK